MSMVQWTPEVSLLVGILNELKTYNSNYITVSSSGKKKKKPDLMQGPRTALDREIARSRQDKLTHVRNKLVPVQPKREE